MRVAVFVKATPTSETGTMPSEQMLADMGRYNETLIKAGIMEDGVGLHPSAKGVRVRFRGKERIVVNGPFAETRELVAGYWRWKVKSLEEAVEWLKKCPNPMPEESEIEIRPLYEAEDFGAALTPELRQQEERQGVELEMGKATAQHYLFFAGRCDEALEFYRLALHARVGMVMRFSDSPEPLPPGMLKPGFEKKVMHAEFTIGGTTLMASDGCGEPTKFDGFRIALTVPTAAVADAAFQALADGGRVDMPLAKTFWSPRYGMVTDRFGIGWMVMVPGQKP
ncbi:MAG: VOC family protein [Planctomycetes bacterium]|nr:VOC family protein [Planctomycetota bacterium]